MELGRINKERIMFQIISIKVIRNNIEPVNANTTTSKNFENVVGICLQKPKLYNDKHEQITDDANLYLLLDREEIFPNNFDSSIIEYSENISVNERFYDEGGTFNEKAKGSEIKIIYKPQKPVDYDYEVKVILKLKGKI